MRNLTLGQARSTIARVANVCTDSDQVVTLINEAQERLLNRGSYPVGSLVRYRFCAGTSDCIVWPRQVRTIESWAVCQSPAPVQSMWYEFTGYPVGPGLQDSDSSPGTRLIDRGTVVSFDNVISSSTSLRRIAVVATSSADVGKTVTLRYVDSNGNKKYSDIGGVVQEGEELTLVSPGGVFPSGTAITSSYVSTGGLYQVVKETTEYPVLLYECSTTAFTRQIAKYEPSETNPIYRQSFVPGFTDMQACQGAEDSDCTFNKQITALVKLQHVPVVVDNDTLVIGNLAALKLMVMAILREEENRGDESIMWEKKAEMEIEGELSSYLGSGEQDTLKVKPDFGAGQQMDVYRWGW